MTLSDADLVRAHRDSADPNPHLNPAYVEGLRRVEAAVRADAETELTARVHYEIEYDYQWLRENKPGKTNVMMGRTPEDALGKLQDHMQTMTPDVVRMLKVTTYSREEREEVDILRQSR